MRRRHLLARFLADERGGAAEFALILPFAMFLLFGMVDAGRFLYAVHRGEKATQVGARYAAVTDPIAPELATKSYVGETVGGVTLIQGDRIPAAALGLVTCNNTSCTCTTSPCPSVTRNATAFTNLKNRIDGIFPAVQEANVVVEYRGSGLGYAGDPNGMDISPLVTVRLTGITFDSLLLFGTHIRAFPSFSYTLPMEDGSGSVSN